MRKKCNTLAVWSFVLALAIFLFSYTLFHHTLPSGTFTTVRQSEPGESMITWLFAIWGVMFLFSGVISLLIGHIFFPKDKGGKNHA